MDQYKNTMAGLFFCSRHLYCMTDVDSVLVKGTALN